METVIADLRRAAALGVDEMVFASNVSPGEQRLDTMETLGREILPALI